MNAGGAEMAWVICSASGRPLRVFNSFQEVASWIDHKDLGYFASKQSDNEYTLYSQDYADEPRYTAVMVPGPSLEAGS